MPSTTSATTLASGVWSSTSSWTGNVVPIATDIVSLNHVITLDINAQIWGFNPQGTGMLKNSTSGNYAVVCGTAGTVAAYKVLPLILN